QLRKYLAHVAPRQRAHRRPTGARTLGAGARRSVGVHSSSGCARSPRSPSPALRAAISSLCSPISPACAGSLPSPRSPACSPLRALLLRVRALLAHHGARELRDRHVHAEADAQERDPLRARDLRSRDLALDATPAEAAGDQDPVGVREALARLLRVGALAQL